MNLPTGPAVPLLALPLLGFSLASCSTTDISKARAPYEQGLYMEAAAAITAIHPQDETGAATDNRAEDNVWLLLEKGKMLLDAGLYAESNVAFYEANRILETLDEEALVSLGAVRSGAAGLLIDDRQSDYIGRPYDRILLPSYVTLNHLMLGEFEQAAIAARQQDKWQTVAEEAYAAEEEKREELDAAAAEEGAPVDSSNALAAFEGKFAQRKSPSADDVSPTAFIASIENDVASWASPAFDEHSVPFGRYIGAIALHANGDRDESSQMHATVKGMVPNCKPVLGPLGSPRTAYVVFENGLAPKRVDRSFHFAYVYKGKAPVYDDNGNKIGEKDVLVPSYIKLPFVGLERIDGAARSLDIGSGANASSSSPLSDVEGVVAREFRDALPGIVARILIRAAIQETAQIAANNEFGMFSVIGGALLKTLVEPDLRGWEALPKQHQVARVKVPDDGVLTFTVVGPAGAAAERTIQVPVGPPVLVYARSTRPDNLVLHACALSQQPTP